MKVESHVSCQEFIGRVTDYLEGEVAESERPLLEQHLLICEGCRTYVQGMECTTVIARELRSDAGQASAPGPAAKARALAAFRAARRNPKGEP